MPRMQLSASEGASSCAQSCSCWAGIGRSDHGDGGDARLALQARELPAEHLEVLRRVDDDSGGTIVDEGAIPAGPHEALRLRRAERARVAYGRSGQRRLVHPDDREPVVVVGALRAVRRGLAERAAQVERGLEPVAVEAHERMAEPVDAAVALVAGACVLADRSRLARPPYIDRRRDAGHEPVGEACAATGVVAARQHVLQVGELEIAVERVRAPDGVHDAVAVREHETALRSHRALDRRHRRPRVLAVSDDLAERPRQALLRRLREKASAGPEVDGGDRLVAAVPREQDDGDGDHGRRAERGGEKELGGPPWRAAQRFLRRYFLIRNFAWPVDVFPLMSVAIHLNVVVAETTNDSPGSRVPVELHSSAVDDDAGFEPSVV